MHDSTVGDDSAPATADSASTAARDVRVVFSRLRRRLREVAAESAGDTELSPSQTSVLTRLAKEGAWTASGLASAERVRPQSMAATIAALENAGMIRRDPDPTDGRRQLITLTDAGQYRAAGNQSARAAWLDQAIRDHLTEAERRQLIDAMALLDRIAHL